MAAGTTGEGGPEGGEASASAPSSDESGLHGLDDIALGAYGDSRKEAFIAGGLFVGIVALAGVAMALGVFDTPVATPVAASASSERSAPSASSDEPDPMQLAIEEAAQTPPSALLGHSGRRMLGSLTQGLPPGPDPPSAPEKPKKPKSPDYGDMVTFDGANPVNAGAAKATYDKLPKPRNRKKAAKAKTREPRAVKRSVERSAPRAAASASGKSAAAPVEVEAEPAPARPVEVSGDAKAAAKRSIDKGVARLKSGDPRAAVSAFKSALASKPGDTKATMGLARAYYAMNRLGDAKKALGRVLARSPSHGRALLLMASVAQEQGRRAEAKGHYQRYIAAHPTGSRAAEVRSILLRL